MTLEDKLKEIQEIKDDGVYELIQALRKAIEQRNDLIILTYYAADKGGKIAFNYTFDYALNSANKELLEILEGK